MNLVIGNTSQLSHYFPDDYVKISSRNIDFNDLKKNEWDSVYITFAEQRIYDLDIDYITPNYINTLKIIEELLPISKKIVCYTTCELWNNLSGVININMLPSFSPIHNEYIISKLLLIKKVKERIITNDDYNKVVFIHPFYFNSIYRSKYFLFGKIFDSIINKKKITVGNLDFWRDMVHAKQVVKISIDATSDQMAGCGNLINIQDFIKDLYAINNLDFDEFVSFSEDVNVKSQQKIIMAKTNYKYTYDDLLNDTQEEIKKAIENGYNR